MKYLFITGAGRSGTTFLWRILNRSPSIHLATEVHYFSSLYHDGFLKNFKKLYQKSQKPTINDVAHCLQRGNHFGDYWERNPGFPANEIEKYFTNRSLNEKNIYSYLFEHDIHVKRKDKNLIKYVGEKTPLNIFHLRKLYKWYPDAYVLFIYRNPIDVLKSEANKPYKPDYPLKRENPLYSYGLVIFVFFEWLSAALLAVFNKMVHKEKFIIISFEQLASNCKSAVRIMTSVLKIEYSEDLCTVNKIGSSFSRGEDMSYWYPPRWIVLLYSLFLHPLRILLNRVSLIHEGTYLRR